MFLSILLGWTSLSTRYTLAFSGWLLKYWYDISTTSFGLVIWTPSTFCWDTYQYYCQDPMFGFHAMSDHPWGSETNRNDFGDPWNIMKPWWLCPKISGKTPESMFDQFFFPVKRRTHHVTMWVSEHTPWYPQVQRIFSLISGCAEVKMQTLKQRPSGERRVWRWPWRWAPGNFKDGIAQP